MAKKSENIYLRKDGRYEGRYIAGHKENGKARYVSVYGQSKAEVREKLQNAKEYAGVPAYEKSGLTFREAAELWLAAKKGVVAATTYDRYRESLLRTLYAEYGDTFVSAITDKEIARYAHFVAEQAGARGKNVTSNTLYLSSGILSMVVDFANGKDDRGHSLDSICEKESYTVLDAGEIERICICAKYNKTPEMLAVLLSLFSGIRLGELCALDWDDVVLTGRQIYVYKSAHRVRSSEDSKGKTELRSEEIPTKSHIRYVQIPEELAAYMEGMQKSGCCVLTGEPHTPADARTIQNRIQRAFSLYKIKGVNFQRFRKTYVEGKADIQILKDVFAGASTVKPYESTLDREWLMIEMKNDLPSLRLLLGLSPMEMGEILGIPELAYRNIESGERDINWGEYLSLLFLFHYNSRTERVVDMLGLYPESLREELAISYTQKQ